MRRPIQIVLFLLLATSFSLHAQTYSIGDVVTNDDGSKGIVFYVTKDRTDGWMVALNDLPTHNWGISSDIPSLQNLNTPLSLLNETSGYDNTDIIRQFHASQGYVQAYGAGLVDFENEWYIPTAGHLQKLLSALSSINDIFAQEGGSTLQWQPYASSTEANTEGQTWAVDFGDHDRDWGGLFVSKSKSDDLCFRAVRNILSRTPLPEPELTDNILDSDCNYNTPIPFQSGQLLHRTPENVNVYTTPICGDIDDDGIVDIVVAHYTATDEGYRIWSNKLGVYNGNDLSLQSTISIPEEIYLQYCPIGLAKYSMDNGALQGAIFVMCNDGKIRSYSRNGQLLNTSDYDPSCEGPLSFADFNNDGYAEVYVGNTVYDAATLKRLCSGPDAGNKGLSYRGSPNSPYPHRSLYAISYAYNVLGDEKLELICGNTIYNVNITSRTNPSLNSITVNKTITPPSGYPQDGQVALADLDLDGEVEVVVTKDLTDDCTVDDAYLYAYRPSNGEILFQYSLLCRSLGFPAICNIDSDPHPEIMFVDYQYDTYAEKMRCMRYTTGNGINTLWETHHNDPSGMTTMAFFDFNLDEIPEIVYRDAYYLNIMNGSEGATLYSYPMRSGTGGEHPIIADINGDGHAEIIVTGLLDEYYGNNGYGSLNVFGNSNWPDARPVWNQYVYNITNVNEDLTVPSFCFNNASVFTASDGTIRRPYNSFLQQVYYITPEGEPYNPSGLVEIDTIGSGCESFTFLDTVYTESGLYDQLVESASGCDTLYHIDVTLGQTVTYDFWRVHCYSYTWNGEEYTESGLYQQTFVAPGGCDSIVTLHLQISDTITYEWSAQACQSFTWNGITYTEPGDHVQEFVAAHDCDSIVTLHLSMGQTLEYEADSTVCGSLVWNGQEYTSSGEYDQQFVDVDGCDSIVHLHLTVNDYPAAIPEIEGLTAVFVATDMILGQYFYSIDSVPFATHYEWLLDGADWPMDTTGTQCDLWITSAGIATLTVRAWNDCGYSEQSIVIHAGFYDVDEYSGVPVHLYPNPAKDKVVIETEGIERVKIYNMLGQCVIDKLVPKTPIAELSLPKLEPAPYIVEIQTIFGTSRTKIIIEKQ